MDHDTAIRIRAAERYALDEMTADEGAAFEAHYFQCADCAADVKVAVRFQANARKWFENHPQAEPRAVADSGLSAASRFRAWWRPAWLSPALATVFAALAGYSWLITIPQLRQQRAVPESVEVYQPVLLRSQTRGEALPTVRVAPESSAAFILNIESEKDFPDYEVEVFSASGVSISRRVIPAWPTVTLRLPGSMLGNGTYTIIVRGGKDGRLEIGKYQFEVRVDSKQNSAR